MARDHARIKLSIWDDPDFNALSAAEQHAYFLLIGHKPLSRCGVTMFIASHFEGRARDLTSARFRTAVKALETARFVVIDDRTHELLIRSYIRHDGVLDRLNMGKAVGTAFNAVISPVLQEAIGDELARLMAEKPDLLGWKGLAATSPKASAMASRMESGMR